MVSESKHLITVIHTLAIGKTESITGMAQWLGKKMEQNTSVIGKTELFKVTEGSNFVAVMPIQDHGSMAKCMEKKEDITLKMGQFTSENFKMDS
jgi:hypothetical protein